MKRAFFSTGQNYARQIYSNLIVILRFHKERYKDLVSEKATQTLF